MKPKRIAILLSVAFIVFCAGYRVFGDIIVFKTGNYQEYEITNVDEKNITVKTPFGEQKFPRSQIVDYFQKELGKPGSDYFRAGEVFAKDARYRNKAIELFEKAVQANPAYREQADRVLSGASPGATTGPTVATVNIPTTTQPLTCPVCGGEGRRQQKTKTMSGTEIDRVIPCYYCDQKGMKYVSIPNGCRICPNCGGWGYKPSTTVASEDDSSSSDSGGTKIKMGSRSGGIEVKQPCFQCSGKGYIGQAKAVETVRENPDLYIAATTGSVGYSGAAGSVQPTTGTPMTGSGSMGPPTGMTGSMPTNTTGSMPTATTATQPTGGSGKDSTAVESSSDEKKDEKKDEPSDSEDEEQSWFQRNMKLILIAGGIALLLVIIVLSQTSKK